jgi:outer membrane biosynthesis protein TonB
MDENSQISSTDRDSVQEQRSAIPSIDTPRGVRGTRRAFGISLSLHTFFFIILLLSALTPSQVMPPPHKLLVQSISLTPQSRVHAHTTTSKQPKGSASKPSSAPAPQPSAPEQPSPEPQAPLPAAPPTEIIADEPPAESAPSQAHEEPSQPSSEPAPSEKQKATSSSAKPSTKQGKGQPTKSPPPSSKGKASSSSKTASTAKTSSQGKGKTGSKNASSKPAGPSYDQKLLAEAMRRLDSSSAGSQGGKGSAGKGSGSGGYSGQPAKVGSVGSLNVEQGLTAEGGSDQEGDVEGYAAASPEACYIGDLIRRLQLNIRLPEPGDVRVKLTLKRDGATVSVHVLGGKKPSIARAIEEKMRSIHFSAFGSSFAGEKEHTFSLRLSNDLLWSCHSG